jgi:hypothetical protein
MRSGHGILGKEFCRFLGQFYKSLSRAGVLSNENIGKNGIKITPRPGTDPNFHLPFF